MASERATKRKIDGGESIGSRCSDVTVCSQVDISDALRREIGSYLSSVLAGMGPAPAPEVLPVRNETALADEIFSVLTHRKFCYLSRGKVQCYREKVVSSLRRRMSTGGAFRFFYDIGPGYHATTRPGLLPLRFDVGLSELLIIAQVNALCRRIKELYEPGARFWLVIDNICGLRTNDIPIERTEDYVRQLRRLIDETGMSGTIRLIVESEAFDLEEYDRLLDAMETSSPGVAPSAEAIDNVARFLGRPCTATEAAERIERYRCTGPVTDGLINRLVRDVHMTQRATGATLGFRPFPGGDQRTQAGELVLSRGSKGQLRPLLLTSRNVDAFDCRDVALPDVLPAPIRHVVYAQAIPAT